MATEVREHEERSHSARYLILIFLVCVATCGVFFSLGFLVGYNERVSHSVPSTEVVTSPPVIPPTVNPPPESAPATPQESAAGQAHSKLRAGNRGNSARGRRSKSPSSRGKARGRCASATATPGSGQASLESSLPTHPCRG